jgi:organic hydroperoxide reductase OsmC/OhrA
MGRKHAYEVTTVWTGNRGEGTAHYRAYDRTHETTTAGRPPIEASSDPVFRGDPDRWNPELLLVAALSQCHMLAYLHLCAVGGVVVVDYRDEASGTMAETEAGGSFTEVVLRPVVTVASGAMVDAAQRLHAEASERCFIASSVNFPVRHEPEALVAA